MWYQFLLSTIRRSFTDLIYYRSHVQDCLVCDKSPEKDWSSCYSYSSVKETSFVKPLSAKSNFFLICGLVSSSWRALLRIQFTKVFRRSYMSITWMQKIRSDSHLLSHGSSFKTVIKPCWSDERTMIFVSVAFTIALYFDERNVQECCEKETGTTAYFVTSMNMDFFTHEQRHQILIVSQSKLRAVWDNKHFLFSIRTRVTKCKSRPVVWIKKA